jgi:RimJ/RimL family protein N-acetyltransferase
MKHMLLSRSVQGLRAMTETENPKVEIETERLRLRSFVPEDFEPMHRLWNDAEVMKYIRPGWTPSREEVVAYFERVKTRWGERGFGHLATTLKETQEFIGYCGFQYVEETPEVELLYGLARPYWRQGYTTELARACLRWAYENTKLDRIIALANPENVGSWRVMEKIGMKYEGMAHHYDADLVCYVMTREKYQPDPAPYTLRHR